MCSSDAGSSASEPGSVGKPADPVWLSFDKVFVTNSAGELIAQSRSNKLHRKCQGCGKELKSCNMKVGEEHLLNCKKA